MASPHLDDLGPAQREAASFGAAVPGFPLRSWLAPDSFGRRDVRGDGVDADKSRSSGA